LDIEGQIFLFVTVLLWSQVCCVILFADYSATRKADLLNPGIVFATLYLFYNNMVFLDSDMRVAPGATQFAYVSMLGLVGILAGTIAAHALPRSSRAARSPVVPQASVLFWGLSLAGLSIAMLLVMFVRNLGLEGLFTADAFERAAATSGVLTGFNLLLPISVGFALPALFQKDRVTQAVVAGGVAAAMGALFLISASRSEILYSALLFLFVYHYCVKRVRNTAILAIGATLLLILIVTGIIRGVSGREMDAVAEAVTVDTIFEQVGIQRLEPYRVGVNSMELVDHGPPEGEFLWGASLLYFVPSLVPRVIADLDRPQFLDAWYIETYAPDIAAKGGGLGFSPLVDAYFNFGAAGGLLVFFVFAYFLNRLHLNALHSPRFSRLRLMDCLLATTFIIVHRISISGYIKIYLYVYLLLGFLFLTWCLYARFGTHSAEAAHEPA